MFGGQVLCFAQDYTPLFSTDVALCRTGKLVFAQRGRQCIDLYDDNATELLRSIKLPQEPTGIVTDGDIAYVTTFKTTGSVEIISLSEGRIERSIAVGSGACAPRLSSDGSTLYVCNQFKGNISKIDLHSGEIVAEVDVLREPKDAIISDDGGYLFVANFLPLQRADLDVVNSNISVIDLATFTKIKDIPLANGSNALRGMATSPNGKYLYVSHNLGRFAVPTSQLQQGWMNTSAFSIINIEKLSYEGCVLVDEPEKGAAGIWDIECSDDYLYISHSGTHEVSIIDHKKMIEKFESYPNKESLDYDLNFLYGLRQRVKVDGNGPRNIVLRGEEAIVPTYFADTLNFIDGASGSLSRSVNLNPNREESIENRGEKYFNDATYCFQGWQSCNGCHPGEGRTDGMNWDLMNDGVGNPKNCKSMLYSHLTPPSMISGIRASANIAVRKGFTHIQFYNVDEEYAECVDAYLMSLEAVPSPYLVDGDLSDRAKVGQKIFTKLRCNDCHSGPYFTDLKMYRIGEDVEFEGGWDTPTLREVWRTAPYLFDGRAVTMRDVFYIHKHGIEKKISESDAEALAEYVLSL